MFCRTERVTVMFRQSITILRRELLTEGPSVRPIHNDGMAKATTARKKLTNNVERFGSVLKWRRVHMIMIITLFVQLISNDIPAPAACTSRSLQHHFAIRADMHKLGLSPFGSTSTSYFSAAKKVNHSSRIQTALLALLFTCSASHSSFLNFCCYRGWQYTFYACPKTDLLEQL